MSNRLYGEGEIFGETEKEKNLVREDVCHFPTNEESRVQTVQEDTAGANARLPNSEGHYWNYTT